MLSASQGMPSAAISPASSLLKDRWPSLTEYYGAWPRAPARQRLRIGIAEGIRESSAQIGDAAREGNDLGLVQQLQQLPDFGCLHARHAPAKDRPRRSSYPHACCRADFPPTRGHMSTGLTWFSSQGLVCTGAKGSGRFRAPDRLDHQPHIVGIGVRRDAVAKVEDMRAAEVPDDLARGVTSGWPPVTR